MEAEDDDLSALRSAALASLSSKPKVQVSNPEEEEDLEALRLAALMTRRQNQKIEVIYQQPVQQQIQRFRPPLFRHMRPQWLGPRPTNLISLTPDPYAGMVRPRHRFSRPPMRPRVPAPAVVRVPVTALVETKVPNKFDRYNSDSSSDEDDENNDKKKTVNSDEENHSDAESVASKRSFSSVSDAEEEEETKDEEGEVKHTKDAEGDDGDSGDSDGASAAAKESESSEGENNNDDDNISIIDDEEDDILAAIEDYLEDRPSKPKKVPEKEADAPKTATSEDGTKKKPNRKEEKQKERPKRQNSVPNTTPIEEKRPAAKNAPVNIITKPVASASVQETAKPDARKMPPAQDREPRRRWPERSEKINPKPIPPRQDRTMDGRYEGVRPRRDEPPAPYGQKRGPNVPLMLPPVSPPRQRRDSDLDSVGTSDLSFLSSDSDEDVKKKMPEAQPKPNRVRTRSMSGDGRKKTAENFGDKKVQRPRDRGRKPLQPVEEPPASRKTAAVEVPADARQRLSRPNTTAGGDLRKRLEVKGLKKNPAVKNREKDTKKTYEKEKRPGEDPASDSSKEGVAQRPPRGLSPVRKTGIISLKKKSARFPSPAKSKSHSREHTPTTPEVSLPDISEARRIIITRPNTSSAKSTVKLQQTEIKLQKRPDSSAERSRDSITAKRKRSVVERSKVSKTKTDNDDAGQPSVRNRKRSVLPPNTPVEEKKQKVKKIISDKLSEPKKWERASREREEEENSGSSEEEEDSSSDSEGEIIDEEVFAFDDSALPAYDDVLGNVDDEEGEYYGDGAKKRKTSQSSSKKRKTVEKSGRKQGRKNLPDSRRIVPKSSPERFSDPENVEERRGSDKNTKPKKPIHQRLGVRLDGTKIRQKSTVRPSARPRPQRRWSGSSDKSSHSSLRWSENEIDDEPQMNLEQEDSKSRSYSKGRTNKQSSVIKVAASSVKIIAKRNESRGSDGDYSDYSEERALSKALQPIKSRKESKKRKRKIMLAGKREKEQSVMGAKARRGDKTSRGINVKDRLGKVILTSVLTQPPAESEHLVAGEPARSRSGRRRTESKQRREGSKRGKKEDVLEARIKRIKEQNGQILRRQKEIEMEKEKFGF